MNIKLILLALLFISLHIQGQAQIDKYTEQTPLKLDANTLNLGYSPNQRHLTLLINEAEGYFIQYDGIRLNRRTKVEIYDDAFNATPSTFTYSQNNTMLIVGTE